MPIVDRLHTELLACCEHAGLDARSLLVFLVEAQRPPGTTPMAYLQPAGNVRPDTVAVFRRAGAERVNRHRLGPHRLAVWSGLPGLPDAALGPMLRHELEHAVRWERSGTPFFEADDLLRGAVRRAGGDGYAAIPSELEANAASAAYAGRALSRDERAQVLDHPECAPLLRATTPPADVVEATLAALAGRDDWQPPDAVGMDAYLDGIRGACAAWDPAAARARVAGGEGPTIEPVRSPG